MKIVTANNFYYPRGGSERVLFDEEKVLKSMGNDVFPFSTRNVRNLPCSSDSFFVPARDIEFSSTLAKIRKLPAFFHNSETGRAFGLMLDSHKPDIVHAHNIYGTLTTAVLVETQRRNIPTVLTSHDAKLVCPTYLCLDHGKPCEACGGKSFYHAALRRCHSKGGVASSLFAIESYFNSCLKRYESVQRIITPSLFFKDLFTRNGIPEKRIIHIANGVDVERIMPAFSVGGYTLYVGRLSPEKGIVTLIEALRETEVPLRIVGDGPLREKAEQMACGAGNIRFEGFKSGSDLAALFQSAMCIVQPSECYENAPMSLLEAYAYGKPVVGSRIGGIPELIQSGETGELFEPGNVEQLREVLVRFWGSRSKLVSLGRSARAMVEERFSLNRHCERLFELYQQITT